MNTVRKLDLKGFMFYKEKEVYLVVEPAVSKLGGSGDSKSRWWVYNTKTKKKEIMFTKNIRRLKKYDGK